MGSRYYEEKEGEQIEPGKISAELKSALNLADNDVPIWIYRMRALGYPPGWLSKAIVDTDDIFDTDSTSESKKRKGAPDESIQYDHSKFIEYPGFNTPLPKGVNDYHYYHNMPPMLPHQQLDYAKKTMSAFKPAPLPMKRTRTSSPISTQPNDSTNVSDISITKNNDKSRAMTDACNPASPDPESSSDTSEESNSLNKTTASEQSIRANRSSRSITGEIKLVSKGSPMPKPSMRVPLERFSEGVVGELLYHENLPNSTGQFDNIRGLLNTMRRSRSETDTSDPTLTEKTSAETDTSNDNKV